jgi:hypothetical protein
MATGGQPNAMALIGGRLKHAIAQSQRLIGSKCSILPVGSRQRYHS